LLPDDRPRLEALLSKVDAFTDEERGVALELVDVTLAGSDDYRFLLACPESSPEGAIAGYLCYGRTPMTCSTYDLYWVATSPESARNGVARRLVGAMEAEIARDGGGLIRVETGSREGHGAAVRFYDALGFARSAVIADFYAPGDDLLIFTRRVASAGEVRDDAPLPEEALIDAALAYRGYAAERDFFLACARRFGGREVRRVLAWECGAGRHLAAFADVGITAAGVDASERMIAFARRILGHALEARPPRVELAVSPLSAAPKVAPVDLSFVALSAIHTLATPEAMIEHLRHAASIVAPSGLHVIEATHPLDLTPAGVHHTEWTEVRGDTLVHGRFRMHIDRARDRLVPVTLEVVSEPKSHVPPARLPSWRHEETWYVPALDDWRSMLSQVPELELVATLGTFNVNIPFEHPAAWRLLLVLRRK
jgi:ribosomal protein S18 acetylase RimI-like enzyme